MCVSLDGIIYFLTSIWVSDIIQATETISFNIDIGNIAVYLYGGNAEENEANKYRGKLPIKEKDARAFIFMFYTVSVVVTIATGIVYGLYNNYCT